MGVALCPGFVFGVRVQLWLSDLLYGTWCQGSLSVSGVECLAFRVDGLAWVVGTVWDWGRGLGFNFWFWVCSRVQVLDSGPLFLLQNRQGGRITMYYY